MTTALYAAARRIVAKLGGWSSAEHTPHFRREHSGPETATAAAGFRSYVTLYLLVEQERAGSRAILNVTGARILQRLAVGSLELGD